MSRVRRHIKELKLISSEDNFDWHLPCSPGNPEIQSVANLLTWSHQRGRRSGNCWPGQVVDREWAKKGSVCMRYNCHMNTWTRAWQNCFILLFSSEARREKFATHTKQFVKNGGKILRGGFVCPFSQKFFFVQTFISPKQSKSSYHGWLPIHLCPLQKPPS